MAPLVGHGMSGEISDVAYIKAADKFIGREVRRKKSCASVSVWYNVSDGSDGGEFEDCEVKISDEEAQAAQAEIDRENEISEAEIEAVAIKVHELGMRMVPTAKHWDERSDEYKRESRAEALEVIEAARDARNR